MAKSVVCFSFHGNIAWYPPAEDNWSKVLLEYVKRELEIGNGAFVSITPYPVKNQDIDDTFKESFQKHLHVEIICDIPESMADDKYAIRARVITLLEDREFDFIKFHNCGPEGNQKISADTKQSV